MDTTMRGYWWLPGGSINDGSVAGDLHISTGRLPVLNLMGSLNEDPSFLTEQAVHVIVGLTDEGRKVTLLRAAGSTSLRQRDAAMYSERWVAQAILLGLHAEQPEEARFRFVDMELDVLTELSPSGLESSEPSDESREWRWRKPAVITAMWRSLSVQIDVAPHSGFVDQEAHELRFWAVPRIRLAWDEAVSIGTILNDGIYPLADLCSLLAGRPATIERVVLHTSQAPRPEERLSRSEIQLVTNPTRRAVGVDRPPSLVTTFDRSPIDLSALVPSWLDLWRAPGMQPLLDAFFVQEGRPSPFDGPTLLGYAVFLEGFHKAVYPNEEASFVDRLRKLWSGLEAVLRESDIGLDPLVETIRDTRNTLAHGRPRSGDGTVSGPDLTTLNSTMDLLVRSLLLRRLGFTESQIVEMMRIVIIRVRRSTRSTSWFLASGPTD